MKPNLRSSAILAVCGLLATASCASGSEELVVPEVTDSTIPVAKDAKEQQAAGGRNARAAAGAPRADLRPPSPEGPTTADAPVQQPRCVNGAMHIQATVELEPVLRHHAEAFLRECSDATVIIDVINGQNEFGALCVGRVHLVGLLRQPELGEDGPCGRSGRTISVVTLDSSASRSLGGLPEVAPSAGTVRGDAAPSPLLFMLEGTSEGDEMLRAFVEYLTTSEGRP